MAQQDQSPAAVAAVTWANIGAGNSAQQQDQYLGISPQKLLQTIHQGDTPKRLSIQPSHFEGFNSTKLNGDYVPQPGHIAAVPHKTGAKSPNAPSR